MDDLNILTELADLYVNMLVDLETHLETIGGTLGSFAPEEGIINVNVDPKHEAHIQEFIRELIYSYNERRATILKSDPFIGIKAILLAEEGN